MLIMARPMRLKKIMASQPAPRESIVRAYASLTVNKTRFCLIPITDMQYWNCPSCLSWAGNHEA